MTAEPVLKRQMFEEANRPVAIADVGTAITVELPSEVSRAVVENVVSATRVLARISQHTTNNKAHNFKKGDLIAAEFRRGMMNVRGWYYIPQEELDAAAEAEEIEPELEAVREMVAGDL